MTVRPIIWRAQQVQAYQAGRKSQHRAPLKLNGRMPEYCGPAGCTNDPTCWGWEDHNHGDWITLEKEPWQRMGWRDWRGAYAVGDRLWVRETFCGHLGPLPAHMQETARTVPKNGGTHLWYRADDDTKPFRHSRWRPSIHMPKWAARIWLTVTEVRVQRLQDISEEDARAEGCKAHGPGLCTENPDDYFGCHSARTAFRELWDSIHGPGAFERNPWVAAITFERAS